MATRESKEIVKGEPARALSPFETMERRFAAMERMFEDFFRRPFSLLGPSRWPAAEIEEMTPAVDLFEEKDDVVVKAELPGMKKENINVDFRDGTLTISGEKKQEEKIEKKDYYRFERSYGSFSRSLRLPTDVQTDKAKASFKDGILEVRIPKTEEAKKKGRKIPIE
jgi:HSP20 family protein